MPCVTAGPAHTEFACCPHGLILSQSATAWAHKNSFPVPRLAPSTSLSCVQRIFSWHKNSVSINLKGIHRKCAWRIVSTRVKRSAQICFGRIGKPHLLALTSFGFSCPKLAYSTNPLNLLGQRADTGVVAQQIFDGEIFLSRGSSRGGGLCCLPTPCRGVARAGW